MSATKWYLGNLKRVGERVWLEDFKWECGWYWSGGHVEGKDFFCHFDGCFLDVPDTRGHPLGRFKDPWTILPAYARVEDYAVIDNGAAIWCDLDFFLDNAQYTPAQWWRIKDLFKQFYALRDAAECFQHGGHCASGGLNPTELRLDMAANINKHIETVIIPEIRKALTKQPATV